MVTALERYDRAPYGVSTLNFDLSSEKELARNAGGLRPESSWCERNPCFLSSLPCFLFCASVVFHKADAEMELKVQKFYRIMTPVKEKRQEVDWQGQSADHDADPTVFASW